MINDNRYCINGIINAVKGYVSSVNKYLVEDAPTLVLDDISVKYPSSEILTDYLGKSTCQAQIRFRYHTENVDGSKNQGKEDIIELPLLIDGIYVYEGKSKLPLNYLVNDSECLIYKDKINISSDLYISLVNGLKIKKDDGSREFVKVDYDVIDPEILKLSDRASKKLGILFGFDKNPEYLTEDVVNFIIANFNPKLRDHALNKKIMTPEMALIRNIEVSRSSIIKEIRGKYYQSLRHKRDNTGTLYLKSLQNLITKFFKGTDQYFTGIQNPTNSNPLIFESMKSKLILENDSSKTSKVVPYSKYDLSFYGLVDPAITPDNSNSSRVNEITRSVVVKDGDTYIKCYTPDFELVEIPFIDYVSSKVLVSTMVDYAFKEVETLDEYEVKFKYKVVKSKDYDYIELPPDYRLSLSGSQIPMVNLSDSVRVAMGAKMINQAIGVIGSEIPRVSSGNDILEANPLIIKFDNNVGEVVEVDAGLITIKLPDGSLVTKTVPKPIKGNNNSNIVFESAVNIGDKVHRGDVIIKPKTVDDKNHLKLGVNARVAMMSYRGYNFEDAVIVSESFARRMTHITIEDVTIEITPDIIVEGFKDIWDRIDSVTPLMVGKRRKGLGGMSKSFRDDIGLNKKYAVNWSAKAPLNIEEAYVYDVKISEGSIPSRSDETDFLLNTGRIVQFDRRNEFSELNELGIPESVFDEQNLQLIKEFKATKGSSYTVKYRLIVLHPMKNGDKLTNRYGSKGVQSLVLPDEKMPRDAQGNPVDVIMNPDAPLGRKNIPQTMELEINQLMDKVFEIQKDLIMSGRFSEARNNFKKYKMPMYFKMTDEELIEYHSTNRYYEYITGSFSNINPKQLSEWKDELGISAGITLWDGVTGKKIRTPIMVADMYLLKLYFLSDAYAKVTSERIPGVSSLALGKGSVTKKGSKHGNMEMDAILANNMMGYAKAMKRSDGASAGWMLANAILTGLIYKTGENVSED